MKRVLIEIRGPKIPFFQGSDGSVRPLMSESCFNACQRLGYEIDDKRIELSDIHELLPSKNNLQMS